MKYIQFLGLVMVLQIQIIEIIIVKLNSNGCRRASCALGLLVRSKVLRFEFEHTPAHLHVYAYIYMYMYMYIYILC